MKTIIFFGFFLLFLTQFCFSQHKILTGVVTMSGQPVSNLTVYTSFVTGLTDNQGRYSIDLTACSACRAGEKISIYTNSPDDGIGSSEQTYTISNDFRFNFSIVRNPNKILIAGIVKNTENGDPLVNINVAIMGLEYEMLPVKTNSFGEFKIYVRKDILPNKNAVLLQVADPNRKYKPLHSDPDLFNINAFANIKMLPGAPHNVKVYGFTRTDVCIKTGDAVSIDATGSIRVGASVGSSDPDGRSSGVLGLSLEQYNIVKKFNHAILMYRFSGESEWMAVGKRKRFISNRAGCLEFQVNDNRQDDNEGYYDVDISVLSN